MEMLNAWESRNPDKRTLVQDLNSTRGCEYEILILFKFDNDFMTELATRGREELIFISTLG